MRIVTVVLALVAGTAYLCGCSDDEPVGGNDAKVQQDGGGTKDGAVKSDGGAQAEAGGQDASAADSTVKDSLVTDALLADGAGNWSCTQITECQKTCGPDLGCVGACDAKGCASAKVESKKVADCAIAKCILDCFGGYDAKCLTCVEDKCGTEMTACLAQQC